MTEEQNKLKIIFKTELSYNIGTIITFSVVFLLIILLRLSAFRSITDYTPMFTGLYWCGIILFLIINSTWKSEARLSLTARLPITIRNVWIIHTLVNLSYILFFLFCLFIFQSFFDQKREFKDILLISLSNLGFTFSAYLLYDLFISFIKYKNVESDRMNGIYRNFINGIFAITILVIIFLVLYAANINSAGNYNSNENIDKIINLSTLISLVLPIILVRLNIKYFVKLKSFVDKST